MNRVNVFMCLRNNENTLHTTLRLLKELQEYNNNNLFYFYIYENDSNDNTRDIVKQFYELNNGKCKFENLLKQQWFSDDKSIDRVIDMAIYRNKMKQLCTVWEDSEYSIILDSNIEFDSKNIYQDILEIFQLDPKIKMVTAYGVVKTNPSIYYDTFALEKKDNFNNLKKNKYVFVNSSFGGFCVIKSKVLQNCKWNKSNKICSEHNFFCKQVLKYGKIASSNIKVFWTK